MSRFRWVITPRLLEELRIAYGDGSFGRRLAQLARIDLLALDDTAIAPITPAERNNLLELLDDRVGSKATLITSPLPVKAWHEWLSDPTLADAILDRIVHRAYPIALKGESIGRNQAKPPYKHRATAALAAPHCPPRRCAPDWTALPASA